jgi:hypothetical protein
MSTLLRSLLELRRALVALSLALVLASVPVGGAPPTEGGLGDDLAALGENAGEPDSEAPFDMAGEFRTASLRLPLAAGLGAMLALRPRRRGTPPRRPPVVQTQIVLAIVGALVMLVVGVSLARAFGIVGVASLIRYRAKINDPKDAVVMLSALAVGLASGVGHYVLAVLSTVFLVGVLWVIESFEPQTRTFELAVKLGDKTADLRPKIEAALRRLSVKYELRGVSEEGVSYLVTAPSSMRTDDASKALTAIAPDETNAVEWTEVSTSKAK